MAYQQHPDQMQDTRTFPAFGYCNSYFVESHEDDDGLFARAAAERERARNVAKQRQKVLGEELSRATAEEYQEDVLDHMEHMEAETMPDIQSIEIQTEIQWFMRPYLLDFLLEAHHAFQLLPETLHLAVNLLDRYCSRRVVYKRHYQLVGCAALLIAAKYGDRKERVPTIRELKSMCCSLYDDDMFTQMEWHVLQTLHWCIGHPTVTSFLQLALTEVSFDPELEHMSWYISELALYHKEFIPVRPSVMARSCLALARCVLNRPQSRFHDWAGAYDPQVVLNLSNHLSHPSQALSRKYASPHLSSASTTIDNFLKHQAMLARQVMPTPANDQPRMDIDPAPPANTYLTPQTPQKAGYASGAHGMITPPITPDKDQLGGYGTSQTLLPRIAPCNPTPPHRADYNQSNGFSVVPQQYMPQPQFVQ
ncbi:G1/S-specific cyclin CCN1 [Fulvia fulva]|uniref:G1/S-specific cyclin CCN1 n=1 Tax=Passalora fulva TaxID=5499 RepID=A0A9Q8L606_PASFU|nr:G1/S-specific cyclin CCN1 [Fulvia fulva]KAK4634110.1 G1/S-specific cyclin CCN1 [Fulvia fulva]KAK4637938.1 G1/S-specific cyclin CCN1 [Fulvia fulva]UJO10853.1 G1/S-specific cyclin CCN1 [Fulvia fulva]WPV09717.1 G1/S-specific cyclin CCN1 [Fulvia fulva]WPV23416.1 G1/S-specific cyclin CCN1 [Fulvia fulva]